MTSTVSRPAINLLEHILKIPVYTPEKPLTIFQGGTSANNALTARTNLAVPGLADNSTITGAWIFDNDITEFRPGTISSNFYISHSTNNPLINFDANDYHLYDRTNNVYKWYIGSTELFRINSSGNVCIGAANNTNISLTISKNITGSTTSYGLNINGVTQSDVTVSSRYFVTSASTIATSFTLPSLVHYFSAQGTFGAGSTVTAQYGFLSDSSLIGATNNYAFYANNTAAITSGKTAYGFYSGVNIASGGGTAYGFYSAGTADNYLAGNLLIGATSTAGVNLKVSKTLTGSVNTYGFYIDSIVQSDSTSSANYFQTSVNSAAASYTIADLRHYSASQGTFGAGSTVTNQYGFLVTSTLTGATNNYGFYSNIASGSNRYNFYAAGTAANYFAGNSTFALDLITGTAALSTSATTGFFWLPSCAGNPSGSPSAPYTNAAAEVVNTTNNYLHIRFGTTWKGIQAESAPVTKAADLTVGATEHVLINNKSGSTCTVTLPAASSFSGRRILISNNQAQTVISASSNVCPLGSGTAGTAILSGVGKWAELISDGTNWIIMAGN